MATPGHTQGHTVFADLESNMLFAGDHVLPHITPSVGFEAVLAELPLGDYLRSLRLVLNLPDMRLLPAHGPVTDTTHARVHALLAHHEERLSASLERIEAGRTPPTRPLRGWAGPAGAAGSASSTRSTRCSRCWRPGSTWTCWRPRGG